MHHRSIHVISTILFLLTAACGGAGDADPSASSTDTTTTATTDTTTETTTDTTADTTTAAETGTGGTTVPGSATATTDVPESTTSSTLDEDAIAMPTTPEPTPLRDGERRRFETSGADFEFVAADGWVATTTPVNIWIFSGESSAAAWVSVTHLKDARVDLGADADPTGIAVPADPYLTEGGMVRPDGTPVLESFRPLPEDWHGYVGGLPGITLGDREVGVLAGADAVWATYTAAGIQEASGVCGSGGTPGVMVLAELNGGWCIVEGDTGIIAVLEVDGERYEVNAGVNPTAGGTDALRAMVDEIVASLRVV